MQTGNRQRIRCHECECVFYVDAQGQIQVRRPDEEYSRPGAVSQSLTTSGWQPVTVQRYAFGEGGGMALPRDFGIYRRESPTRSPHINADVYVPAGQAAIYGVAGAMLAATVVALAGRDVAAIWQHWYLTLGGFAVSASLAAFRLLNGWNSMLYAVEELTSRAVEMKEEAGRSAADAPSSKVVIDLWHHQGNGRTWREQVSLPEGVDLDRLRQVAVALRVNQATFSRRGLNGALAETAYSDFRQWALDQGLADGSRQKTVLTTEGEQFFDSLLPGSK